MGQDITIRGQEVSVTLVLDGVPQGGSFAKMEQFTATPNTELQANDYIGEVLQVPDKQHHGWDFNWTMREQDRRVLDAYQEILDAEEESRPQPVVHIVITTKYRSPEEPSTTIVIQDAVLKLDSYDIGGRAEYVKSTWSGKARKVREV